MAHKAHHHHHAHGGPKHHLSAAAHDGWVESITSLKETDDAVGLLTQETPRAPGAPRGPSAQAGGAAPGAAEGGATSTGTGTPAPPPPEPAPGAGDQLTGPATSAGLGGGTMPAGSVTREEDFDGVLDHALGLLGKEIEEVGEMVLEVGGPSGWGPVGLSPTKLAAVMARVRAIADAKHAQVTQLRERSLDVLTAAGPVKASVADVLVRRIPGPGSTPIEVRVAIIGNVDSGKSTMVGVLTRSMLDDGRGLARSKVFKHHHEETTGRTSSISQHTLCLDAGGAVLNDTLFRTQTCGDYISRAAKVITLVDLAGHERYFRTTAYGLTGHMPDYAGLIVGANMGVVGMCKEHLGVALALKVPVFFVITKVDIAPDHILKQTVQTLTTILKKPGVRKKPFLVRTVDDVLLCARVMNSDALAPIFLTSSVTGRGLDLVRIFFDLLPQRQRWSEKKAGHAEFVIDEVFGVPGVGTVVAGTVKKGVIHPNMSLLLGPDIADGSFKPAAIKSIHYKRLPVSQVVAGQTAALALKKIKRSQVRKGMALVDERLRPAATWEFDADIAILTHSTTIQPRYQAVIHCEIIRQAARVVAMDCERLRSGDRACVRFRFIQRPEYVTLNTRFVFREGRTKGIGIVIGTEHEQLPLPPPPNAPGSASAAGEEGSNGDAQAESGDKAAGSTDAGQGPSGSGVAGGGAEASIGGPAPAMAVGSGGEGGA